MVFLFTWFKMMCSQTNSLLRKIGLRRTVPNLSFFQLFFVHVFFRAFSEYFNTLFFLLHILGIIYESSVTSNDLVMASKAIIALQTRKTNLVVSAEYIFPSFIRKKSIRTFFLSNSDTYCYAKSLYRSRAVRHFYWIEYEIWADFGPVGNTGKKLGAIMSNIHSDSKSPISFTNSKMAKLQKIFFLCFR